eukprot:12884678-Prorocentrum_lima.AAC.1
MVVGCSLRWSCSSMWHGVLQTWVRKKGVVLVAWHSFLLRVAGLVAGLCVIAGKGGVRRLGVWM